MKPLEDFGRSDWEWLIDEYIFSERDRAILKRKLLDGITNERLAEEFNLSTTQIQRIVSKNAARLYKRA